MECKCGHQRFDHVMSCIMFQCDCQQFTEPTTLDVLPTYESTESPEQTTRPQFGVFQIVDGQPS